MMEPTAETIDVAGCSLRSVTWGTGAPDIVLLHDGLGSIGQWRSVPREVAQRTGRTLLAYERAGHGQSTPTPRGPWPTDWLHREAGVLHELLNEVGAEEAVLVGHSDGGSISLLHAAEPHARSRAVLALAPHSWVEDICFSSIVGMRANREKIVEGLSRHHSHPAEVFEAWSGVWVSEEFRSWDVRPQLGGIRVPTLIAQGRDDAYASEDQAHLTAAAAGAVARSQIVDGVGHIMHHDDAEVVVDLIADFVNGQFG